MPLNSFFVLKSSSYHQVSLLLYVNFIKVLFKKLNIEYSIIFLPIKKKRVTLLKSPHVNKKAREQFEMNKFSVMLKFKFIKNDQILQLINLNKPKIIENNFKIKVA